MVVVALDVFLHQRADRFGEDFNQRHQFDDITPEERELCYGLFGTGDTTVNPINAYNTFTKYYAHAERFDGEHQLNERSIRHALLPLLKRLFGERYEVSTQEPLPDYMKY